jgi:hypothetical protein
MPKMYSEKEQQLKDSKGLDYGVLVPANITFKIFYLFTCYAKTYELSQNIKRTFRLSSIIAKLGPSDERKKVPNKGWYLGIRH